MATSSPREFEKALAERGVLPRIVLLHGNNDDLKADLFKSLCRRSGISPDDPFRFVRLEHDSLDLDSGRLADELGSISMFGGSRLVHARASARQGEQAISQAADVPGDWLLVVETPDLSEAEWLSRVARKLEVVAIACGEEDASDFRAFVEREMALAGMAADRDVIDRLISLVGEDRASVRGELLKLGALAGVGRNISLEDVNSAVADASSVLSDETAASALSGEVQELGNALDRLGVTGDPVQALMAAHRLAMTMHRTKSRQWSGQRQDKHAPAWNSAELRGIVRSLGASVRQTRSDSSNAGLIAERALVALGQFARLRKR